MAPRFYASPFKNAVATPAKKEGWWAELPVSTSTSTDSADLVRTSADYWLAQSTSAGHLVCLPYDKPGKFNSRPQTLQVTPKSITSFDVSHFDDLVAAGSDDGKIEVHNLPSLLDFTESQPLSSSPLATLSHPAGRNVESISFHPTSSGILLASSREYLDVFDVHSGSSVFSAGGGASQVWSASWSLDGRLVSSITKDGKLSLYDVRSNSSSPAQQTTAHEGQKCSRHVWLANDQIFTTGFSKTREREYSLFDGRNLGSAIKSQRVDTSTAALVPVADVERGIVYMAGKGDMTLRWVEVGGPATFTEGGTPVPIMVASMALVPPRQLNLMKAEINRLIVITTDAVVPISVEVPRRQYIDFHSDLFPPVQPRTAAQDGKAWLQGGDATLDREAQDPQKKPTTLKRFDAALTDRISVISLAPPTVPTTPSPSGIPVSPPVASRTATPTASSKAALPVGQPSTPASAASTVAESPKPTPTSASASPSEVTRPSSTAAVAASPATKQGAASSSVSSAPARQPEEQPAKASTQPAKAVSPPSKDRFNPRWSRKFLSGKTPLKPDYFDVHDLSATMGADVQMLKANTKHFVFPLAGAGGRLAVHNLSAKGRLPTQIPSFVCGATLVDFELDPFDSGRVFVASDDSKIRVFRVPENGLEEDSGDAEAVLHDPKMDRIVELEHHPSAKDVLLSVSDDHGHPTLRLWDLSTQDGTQDRLAVVWRNLSSRLVARRQPSRFIDQIKKVIVLDPRSSADPVSCASHDSIRPIRIAWLSPTHFVTTGFTRAANREIILYKATATEVKKVASKTLDISPAPLFPYVDVDTNIVLLYSRGERSCHAYEVQPDDSSPFGVLPSFEHGTLQSGFAFLPKKHNDIRNAEVIHALRLTPSTVEVVNFSVPRARTEFFQDDIYVPTRDVEMPTMTAREWMDGANKPLNLISLMPPGLTPLSQAPETAAVISTRNKIAKGPQMTESQKAEAYMDRLFKAAKEDGDDEEPDRTSHRPQDDDDW